MATQENSKNSVFMYTILLFSLTILAFLATGSLFIAQQNTSAQASPALGNLVMFLAITTGVLLLASVASTVLAVLNHLNRLQEANNSMVSDLRRATSGQTRIEAIMTSINENITLSESIKSIAFRRNDLQVLIQAIHQDTNAGQWASAERLIEELESRFGEKQQAQKLRQELESNMQSTHDEKIEKAIDYVRSLCEAHDYDLASNQEQYLLELYFDNDDVIQLQGYVANHRQNYKRDLLQELRKLSADNDYERGIDILKKLDPYLTPTEAKALEESARDIIRARLHGIGVKFSLFVTEHAWHKALEVGKEIVNDYPNSRMAQEVREKIPALQECVAAMHS